MKKIFFAASLAALLVADICAAQSTSRGVKREKEACEEMEMQAATNPRASGSGTSSSEAIAFNIAKLQARNELAAQLAAEVTGMVQHRAEQITLTAGAGTNFSTQAGGYEGGVTGNESSPKSISGGTQRDSIAIAQRVSQILTNTRPICKNAYDQPNGSVLVYVCLEMGLQEQRELYSELKEEGVLEQDVNGDGSSDVDFDEKEFLIELAKAREEYNAKKAQQEE